VSNNLVIFLVGIIVAPVAILLHEFGHFGTAFMFGLKPHLHFALTTTAPTTSFHGFLVTAAGPIVTALISIGGIISLWSQRRHQVRPPKVWRLWLATFCALCAGRWLRPPSHLSDEVRLSAYLGLAPGLLPCAAVALGLVILVLTVRLHEPGKRLIPFSSAILGLCFGIMLWTSVLGPRVLP
jgi:hypothetical protein